MIILWDGLKSLVVALFALFVCGVPVGLGVALLLSWPVPDWMRVPGWIALVGLACIGLVLAASFLRKAWRGTSPMRDRRR